MEIRLGQQQNCPACGMYNRSGLVLPGQCVWCHGIGNIELGAKIIEGGVVFITGTDFDDKYWYRF